MRIGGISPFHLAYTACSRCRRGPMCNLLLQNGVESCFAGSRTWHSQDTKRELAWVSPDMSREEQGIVDFLVELGRRRRIRGYGRHVYALH
jgi:hypothetical protein